MHVISMLDSPKFEDWVRENYPAEVKEWEEIASEFQDLDEYLAAEHYQVIKAWDKHKEKF